MSDLSVIIILINQLNSAACCDTKSPQSINSSGQLLRVINSGYIWNVRHTCPVQRLVNIKNMMQEMMSIEHMFWHYDQKLMTRLSSDHKTLFYVVLYGRFSPTTIRQIIKH